MHATRSIYNWWIWWYDCDRRRSSAAAVTVRTATKIYRTHGATMNQHKRYILMSNDAHGTWLMRWTELLWIGLTDRHALREIATSQSCTVHCLINMEMGRHLLHYIFEYLITPYEWASRALHGESMILGQTNGTTYRTRIYLFCSGNEGRMHMLINMFSALRLFRTHTKSISIDRWRQYTMGSDFIIGKYFLSSLHRANKYVYHVHSSIRHGNNDHKLCACLTQRSACIFGHFRCFPHSPLSVVDQHTALRPQRTLLPDYEDSGWARAVNARWHRTKPCAMRILILLHDAFQHALFVTTKKHGWRWTPYSKRLPQCQSHWQSRERPSLSEYIDHKIHGQRMEQPK